MSTVLRCKCSWPLAVVMIFVGWEISGWDVWFAWPLLKIRNDWNIAALQCRLFQNRHQKYDLISLASTPDMWNTAGTSNIPVQQRFRTPWFNKSMEFCIARRLRAKNNAAMLEYLVFWEVEALPVILTFVFLFTFFLVNWDRVPILSTNSTLFVVASGYGGVLIGTSHNWFWYDCSK
jgi:hypothetical protein